MEFNFYFEEADIKRVVKTTLNEFKKSNTLVRKKFQTGIYDKVLLETLKRNKFMCWAIETQLLSNTTKERIPMDRLTRTDLNQLLNLSTSIRSQSEVLIQKYMDKSK